MKSTKIMLLVTGIMMLVGCYTEKQAVKNVVKAHNTFPQEVQKLFIGWYPVNESTTTNTEYIQGEPYPVVGPTNYVTVDCDSVVKANANKAPETGNSKFNNVVTVPCPPNMVRVDTLKSYQETIKKNNVEIEYWKGMYMTEREEHVKDNADKEAKINQQANTVKNLWITIIVLGVIIAFFIAAKWLLKWL